MLATSDYYDSNLLKIGDLANKAGVKIFYYPPLDKKELLQIAMLNYQDDQTQKKT